MATRRAVATGQTGSFKVENGIPTTLIRLSTGTLVVPFIKTATDTKWTYFVSTNNGEAWNEVSPTTPSVTGTVEVPSAARRLAHRLGPGDKIVTYDQDGWLGKATLTAGITTTIAFEQAVVRAHPGFSTSWSRLKANIVTLSGATVNGVIIQESIFQVPGGHTTFTGPIRVEFGQNAKIIGSGASKSGYASLDFSDWDMLPRALAEGGHTGDGITASTTATRTHVVFSAAATSANLIHGLPLEDEANTYNPVANVVLATNVDVFDVLFTGSHLVAFHNAPNNTVGAASRDEGRTQTRVFNESPPLPAGEVTILRAAYLHSLDTFAVLAGDGTVQDGMLNLWLSYFHSGSDTWQPWLRVDGESDWENKAIQGGVAWDPYPSDGRARWALSRISGIQRDIYFYTAKIGNLPGPPTWETPEQFTVHAPTAALTLEWEFVDPDEQAFQSAYRLRRTVDGGPWEYWTGAAWEDSEGASNKSASTATTLTMPSDWAAAADLVHEFQVQTWDEDDNGPSAWSEALRVRVGAAPVEPTVTAPAVGDQINQAFAVSWTVAEQLRWQVQLVGDSSGDPDLDAVHYDSGVRSDGDSRTTQVPTFASGTYHVGLRTWSLRDVTSDWVWVRISLHADPPRQPTAAVTAGRRATRRHSHQSGAVARRRLPLCARAQRDHAPPSRRHRRGCVCRRRRTRQHSRHMGGRQRHRLRGRRRNGGDERSPPPLDMGLMKSATQNPAGPQGSGSDGYGGVPCITWDD